MGSRKEIDKTSSVPLYKQVKEYILRFITEGGNDVSLVPPEIEICRNFDISRATVRSAFMELVKEGVLERIPGKGTFVKERPNTLVFANWQSTESPTAASIEELLTRFNNSIKHGFIKSLGIPYSEIERQLLVRAAGGGAPDISSLIYLWTPLLAYNGALEPLDHLYTESFIQNQYPQTLEGVSYAGRMYGVNWINAPTILVYHKDILDEYIGGDRLDIEYYDELLEYFIAIHEKSSGEIIPFSIPVLDDELFLVFILSNFLHSFGGGIYSDSGEIVFHSGETQEAFAWLKNFITKGHVNVSNSLIKNRKMLSIGKLAFLCEGPWMRCMIPAFRGEEESRITDIGYAPLPKSPKGKTYSVLWNHTLSIFRQCENRELAEEFISYLAMDRSVAVTYYRLTGGLPILKDEVDSNPVYDDELGRVLRTQLKNAHQVKVHDPATFNLSVAICAKAARDILIGETNIPKTLNHYASILKALNSRSKHFITNSASVPRL